LAAPVDWQGEEQLVLRPTNAVKPEGPFSPLALGIGANTAIFTAALGWSPAPNVWSAGGGYQVERGDVDFQIAQIVHFEFVVNEHEPLRGHSGPSEYFTHGLWSRTNGKGKMTDVVR
jgi:hypothetical protein